MNTLIQFANDCVGYACGPENSTPAGKVEVIRDTVTTLANTGADPMVFVWWVCAAVLCIGAGGALFSAARREDRQHR